MIDPLVNSFFCVCLQHFNVLPIVLDFFALMQGLGTHLGGWGRIISPKFPEGIYKCFYFAYHMFGEEMGRLYRDCGRRDGQNYIQKKWYGMTAYMFGPCMGSSYRGLRYSVVLSSLFYR